MKIYFYTQDFLLPSHPDSYPGSLQPIPQGLYTVGSLEWAGSRGDYSAAFSSAIGPFWVAITATFGDDRGAFGFHMDHNYTSSPGSAGCVVFQSLSVARLFVELFNDPRSRPRKLRVDWGI